MKFSPRFITALVAGCLTAIALGLITTVLARGLWPGYTAAQSTKAYSLSMLLSRLLVGAVVTAIAAAVATVVAQDRGRAAWWLGGLFLALSLPDHVLLVWRDYPAWYHVVYLCYLVPLAGFGGQLASDFSE